MKKGILVLCLITIGTPFMLFAGGGTENSTELSQKEEKIVVMTISSPWSDFYPYEVASGYDELMNITIFDRLADPLMDLSVLPRALSSWESTEGGKKMICHVNKDSVWHDGTPVTAEDVVWSFQLFSNPEATVNRRNTISFMAGVDNSGVELSEKSIGAKVLDPYTLELEFKNAMGEFTVFNTLKQFVVVPKHLLKDIPPAEMAKNEIWRKPIGSGPFMYESEISGERVVLAANQNYPYGPIDFDKLIYRVVPTSNWLAGLMSGEIDITTAAGGLSPSEFELAASQPNLVASSEASPGFSVMTINNSRDYFTVNVRRALTMALNRQAMVDQLLGGYGSVPNGMWPVNHPYYCSDVDWPQYDPEGARAILEQEGWDFDRELELIVPSGNVTREKSAVMVQEDFKAIGVKLNLRSADFATMMKSLFNNETDFGMVSHSGSPEPNEIAVFYNLDAGCCNLSGLTDSEYSKFFVRGLEVTDFESRYSIYKKFQEYYAKNTPYITLYSADILPIYNTRLSNIHTADFNTYSFRQWEWKVEE